MPRISEYFHLGRTQPELDFVDVDVVGDTLLFIDPRALRCLPSEWAGECVSLIQNFFDEVLNCIKNNDDKRAVLLLSRLREPNETRLGYSTEWARGRALGPNLAKDVWASLSESMAAKTGLLEDLEDTILMVEGISYDLVSDIATNVIREPLIRYTQEAAGEYGIPLQGGLSSGYLWNPVSRDWDIGYESFPVAEGDKLLLVPKSIVRRTMDYDEGEYERYYMLEFLMDHEKESNSELVTLLKNGEKRVYKTELIKKYGTGKKAMAKLTLEFPEVLEKYRARKRMHYQPPLSHEAIAEAEGTDLPDWGALLTAIWDTQPGQKHATEYHNSIEGLLSAALYPDLTDPRKERPIHDGRKRIDITYTNAAQEGFFQWLGQHYPASHVFVECKNYSTDPANPELDQLAGRFSPSRGQFGLLVCRHIDDKEVMLKRCRDTAQDDRGYIVALDDDDLAQLVDDNPRVRRQQQHTLLKERFDRLIM